MLCDEHHNADKGGGAESACKSNTPTGLRCNQGQPLDSSSTALFSTTASVRGVLQRTQFLLSFLRSPFLPSAAAAAAILLLDSDLITVCSINLAIQFVFLRHLEVLSGPEILSLMSEPFYYF